MPQTELLFSYGTLRQPEVQLATFGRELDGRRINVEMSNPQGPRTGGRPGGGRPGGGREGGYAHRPSKPIRW